MNVPRFSILCASYNHSKYIGRLIDSALAQSFDDFELVIVDDCSTDDTEAVVRGYSDGRIKFSRNEINSGINYTLQAAFERSCGQFIIFIGSDDEFAPEFLQNLNEAIESSGRKIFYTDYLFIDGNSNLWEKQPAQSNRRFHDRFEALFYMFNNGNPFSSPGMAIERNLFASILPLPPLVVQHQDFFIHVNLLFKADYEVLKYRGVRYRQFKGGNISRFSIAVDTRIKEENNFIWDVFLRQKDYVFLSKVFNREITSEYDILNFALESSNPDLQEWAYLRLVAFYSAPEKYEALLKERNLSYKDFLGLVKNLKKYKNWYYMRGFLRNVKCFGLFN